MERFTIIKSLVENLKHDRIIKSYLVFGLQPFYGDQKFFLYFSINIINFNKHTRLLIQAEKLTTTHDSSLGPSIELLMKIFTRSNK